MQQRVDEAAAEKALRVRNEEEMEKAQSTIKKMKEKQEQLLAAAGGNVSAGELQMKDERDKLLVSFVVLSPQCLCRSGSRSIE